MPYYLVQATYSPQARAGLINNPHDREAEGRHAMPSVGGSLEGFWFALGEYDLAAIGQFPDNSSVTAFVLAVSATGAVSCRGYHHHPSAGLIGRRRESREDAGPLSEAESTQRT